MKHILASLTIVLSLMSVNAVAQYHPDEQKIMSQMNTGAHNGVYVSKEVTPFYVIQDDSDFYEIQNDNLKGINPDWIEKVEVLKGESGTRIFGERGGNGVIIITLKKDDKAAREYIKTIKKNKIRL